MNDYGSKTTDQLFDMLTDALMGSSLGTATAIADEMCRPGRKGTCYDLLADKADWPLFRAGYTAEQLQGLRDRMDQFNAYVEAAYDEKNAKN